LETAFEIEYTHGDAAKGRVLVFNAEIDALPGIGHACGHNLIATSSIAAFIATCESLKSLASKELNYTVRLLGTPAEESGGGKIRLLDNGAYKDVDACLMLHPAPVTPNRPDLLSLATAPAGGFLANDKVRVTYTGKPAHAAAAPWEGVNALDAVVAAYVNISLLRQQMQPTQRVHGIIVNGGDRPNIIPWSASVDYYIRSPTLASLKPLTEKVVKCFEAAAVATGCEVDFEWSVSPQHPSTSSTNILNIQGPLLRRRQIQHTHMRKLRLCNARNGPPRLIHCSARRNRRSLHGYGYVTE
jgi:amidohydrolase